jgi:GNAT superfamily N-acetyltransferase
MTDLTIKRIIGEAQKAEMRRLHEICFETEKKVDCDPGGFHLAAFDGKTMVAFALAIPSPLFPQAIYIIRVGVLPDYRGRGLQKEMMRRLETWAKQKGFVSCVSDTANFSVASMRAFISLEYKPFWPEQPAPWALPYSVYWQKSL